MKIFWYILREYLKYVFGTVIMCLFLFILFDFIHKTTNYFAKFQPSADLIAQFYLYQIPFQLLQVFPIASLLASVIVMVLLNRSNEVTAMRAAGMPPLAIGLPLITGGFLLTFIAYSVGEFVVPSTSKKMHYVRKVLIEGDDALGTAEDVYWMRKGSQIFHFKEYDHKLKTLKNVQIVSIDSEFRPVEVVNAQKAEFQTNTKNWLLSDITRQRLRLNGEVNFHRKEEILSLDIPIEPEKLNLDRRMPDEMSIKELGEIVNEGSQKGTDVLSYRISWHIKWAYPLAALIISLLGLKFGYRSERAAETIKSVIIAFTMGISYWFILSSARALSSAGDLHPFIAGWMANFVMLAIVLYQTYKLHKISQ